MVRYLVEIFKYFLYKTIKADVFLVIFQYFNVSYSSSAFFFLKAYGTAYEFTAFVNSNTFDFQAAIFLSCMFRHAASTRSRPLDFWPDFTLIPTLEDHVPVFIHFLAFRVQPYLKKIVIKAGDSTIVFRNPLWILIITIISSFFFIKFWFNCLTSSLNDIGTLNKMLDI